MFLRSNPRVFVRGSGVIGSLRRGQAMRDGLLNDASNSDVDSSQHALRYSDRRSKLGTGETGEERGEPYAFADFVVNFSIFYDNYKLF